MLAVRIFLPVLPFIQALASVCMQDNVNSLVQQSKLQKKLVVMQLAREGADRWHLERQMQCWGFLRLASRTSQWWLVVPVLQPCVLVLSRILCLTPVSQGDSGTHGDCGIASACGHGWVVVIYMLRLSPAVLPSIPLAGTVSRQSKAHCPVRLFNSGNCSSVPLRHPWYIKAFI